MGIDLALQDLLVRGYTSNSAVGAFGGALTLSRVIPVEGYLLLFPHGKQDFESLRGSIEPGLMTVDALQLANGRGLYLAPPLASILLLKIVEQRFGFCQSITGDIFLVKENSPFIHHVSFVQIAPSYQLVRMLLQTSIEIFHRELHYA